MKSHQWRTVDNSARYLLPYLRPDSLILDVGCGPGTLTVDLARKVPDGFVIGIDNVESVIALAKSQDEIAQRQVKNVSFHTADIYDENLTDIKNVYDIIHAHQTLQHLPDPVEALRQMSKHLKPGGIIAVRDATYGRFAWTPPSEGLTRWLDVYRQIARLCSGEPDAGDHLTEWAQLANLEIVSTTESTWSFTSADDVAWWGDMWADRVLNSNFATHAKEFKILTDSELQQIHDSWVAWYKTPRATFTVPHGELIARYNP